MSDRLPASGSGGCGSLFTFGAVSTKSHHISFALLAVLAPGFVLLMPTVYFWNPVIARGCVGVGMLLTVLLLVWSLAHVTRSPFQAVLGLGICLVVLWLLVMIPSWIKIRETLRTPNQAVEPTATGLSASGWRVAGRELSGCGSQDPVAVAHFFR